MLPKCRHVIWFSLIFYFASAVPVKIVDEHHDAMLFWQFLSNNTFVAHIDTHSDLAVPESNHVIIPQRRNKHDSIHKWHKLAKIDNFLLVSQYAQFISPNGLWIRSNFKDQVYDTHCNRFKATVGVRPPSAKDSYLCFANFEKECSLHNATLDAMEQSHFDECTNVVPHKHSIQIDWATLTMDQALQNETHVPADFILDIDEDYFAASDSVMYHTLKTPQNTAMLGELKLLLERSCRMNVSLVQSFCHNVLYHGLRMRLEHQQLVTSLNGKNTILHSTDPLLQMWCGNKSHQKRALFKLFKLLEYMVAKLNPLMLAVLKLDYEYPQLHCNTLGLFGVCTTRIMPVCENPSEEEIALEMTKLEALLRKWSAPRLVTIARSLDGFTPAHLQVQIEEKLLAMLARVYGSNSIEYLKGVPVVTRPEIVNFPVVDVYVKKKLHEMAKKNRTKMREYEIIGKRAKKYEFAYYMYNKYLNEFD